VPGLVALIAMLPQEAATQAVALSQPERAEMKAYVVKEKIRPAELEEKVTVGTIVPAVVLLRPPPASWPAKVARFQYIYHDNRIVLVDPGTRRVVQIVD
jgi:hypothetical protein